MKLARVLFVLPSVTFLFIGAAHTFVHLTELSTPEIEAALREIGEIGAGGGQVAEMRDLWHGLSLLMGFFSMGLGGVNLASLRAVGQDAPPPVGVTLVSIMTLCAVGVIGALYLGPIQLFGAPFGIACYVASIIAGKRAVKFMS